VHASRGRSDTYSSVLNQLREVPRLAAVLGDADKNRGQHLMALLEGARLRGLEQLLGHLDMVAAAFGKESRLQAIEFLIHRASRDFETAVEATLSGYPSVAVDAMRDVMEIELLVLDFALELNRIEAWLIADSATRWRNFRPAVLRDRLREMGIGRYKDLVADPDYRAHSEALHVSPRVHPAAPKGVQTETGLLDDAGFWEIFEHGRRLLFAIDGIRESAGATWREIPAGPDLLKFQDAWARTQQMQEMYLGLLILPEQLQERLGREPTPEEVLRAVLKRLERQELDPRLPFAGGSGNP